MVRDPAGRVVQVSRLLHLVLSGIDGQRTVGEIAERVSTEFGRTVSTGNVEYLLDRKLAPLGLLARADGAPGPANPGWDQGVLTLRFRCTLIPEAGVQFFARLFRPLFTPAVVLVALGGLIVSDAWLVHIGQLNSALGYVLTLLVTALLAVHWHLLPAARTVTPRPSAAGDVTVQRPPAARPHLRRGPAARPVHRAVRLRPVSAHGFDPLDTPGDPNDENDALAGYAIDGDPATAWRSQYYLGNPVFGGLKAGSGLILDMGRRVGLRSVTITFGAEPGADVAIEVGGDDTLAASTLGTFTTVATADGVGGTHTFRTSSPARGRYLLIWFTRLPPVGPGRFQAEIYGITARGSAGQHRSAP